MSYGELDIKMFPYHIQIMCMNGTLKILESCTEPGHFASTFVIYDIVSHTI